MKSLKWFLPLALLAACAPPARSGDNADTAKLRAKLEAIPMKDKVKLTNDEWKKVLTPEQYHIMRESGTERPFANKYSNNHEQGVFVCAACRNPLFNSDTKFESGTGWPSFFAPISKEAVFVAVDNSHGMARDEVVCARCSSHLGHVFDDGPKPTGKRYCMNSAALDLTKPGK